MTIPAIYHWPAVDNTNAIPANDLLIASYQTFDVSGSTVRIANPVCPGGQRLIWFTTNTVNAAGCEVLITGTNLANQIVKETVVLPTATGASSHTTSAYQYASIQSMIVTGTPSISIGARWGNTGILGFWQNDWNKHVGNIWLQVIPRSAPVSPGATPPVTSTKNVGAVATLTSGSYTVYQSLDRIIDIYEGASINLPTVYSAGPTLVALGQPTSYPAGFAVSTALTAATTAQIAYITGAPTLLWTTVSTAPAGFTLDFTIAQQGPA